MPPELRPSTGPTAAEAHRRGAEELAAGRSDEAVLAFRAAVLEDPCFALGHAGLAVALVERGDAEQREVIEAFEQARRCSRRLSRGERHHVQIVVAALRGDTASASAFAREHLSEYPEDSVVARLLAGWEGQ